MKQIVNLPGTGDTMIMKVVPSGGDQRIAPRLVEACDLPKRGRLGCIIFDSGGLRSRNPHLRNNCFSMFCDSEGMSVGKFPRAVSYNTGGIML